MLGHELSEQVLRPLELHSGVAQLLCGWNHADSVGGVAARRLPAASRSAQPARVSRASSSVFGFSGHGLRMTFRYRR
jgi:hypothetical protein